MLPVFGVLGKLEQSGSDDDESVTPLFIGSTIVTFVPAGAVALSVNVWKLLPEVVMV